MVIPEYVFWVSLLVVVYTYALYPVFLFVACALVQARRDLTYLRSRKDRRCPIQTSADLPPVSLIIPAYNEEARLSDKIANINRLDYPPDALEVIFVSDGSTDGTDSFLRSVKAPSLRTVFRPVRGGKASALNEGVACSSHDILVFSDAATLFEPDAIRHLVRHFAEPRVGVVCGALRFHASPESRATEGVYWGYESVLRLLEARLGATLTASGAIYAIRRKCYSTLPPDTLVEDLVIPLNARKLGYRVLYDPEAVGTDFAASTVAGEFTRRVRVATGSFRVLGQLTQLRLDPMTAFAFVSHKVLRWVLPFFLIAMLVSSGILLDRPLFQVVFGVQLLFYAWAGVGFLLRGRLQGIRYGLLPYYLLAIHLAYLVGFVRCLKGHTHTGWPRVS